MMFVHVIARLTEDLKAAETRLDDLNNMAMEVLNDCMPEDYTSGEEAMLALIEACEEQAGNEARRLSSSLKGYEKQRDFRA